MIRVAVTFSGSRANYLNYREAIIDIVAVLGIIIGCFPPAMFPTEAGLDASWIWYNGYAFAHHMQWGSDVLWTYGPLGFLGLPYQYGHRGVWLAAYLVFLALRLMWFAALYLTIRTVRRGDRNIVDLVALLILFLYMEFEAIHVDVIALLLPLFLLLRFTLLEPDQQRFPLVESTLAGSLFALSSLIKFTSLIVAVPTVITAGCIALVAGGRRDRTYMVVLIASFLIAFIVGWGAAGQEFSNLPGYVWSSVVISSGYSAAMAIPARHILLLLAMVLVGLYLASLYTLYRRRGARLMVLAAIATGFAAFVFWKEGFVRGGFAHAGIFFLFMSAIFLMLSVLERWTLLSRTQLLVSAGVIVAFWIQTGIVTALQTPRQFWDRVDVAWKLATESGVYGNWLAGTKNRLRSHYRLPQAMVDKVRNQPLAVMPWDLLIAFAYGARLKAPPVSQLYSTYTPQLDAADAKWLTVNGPKYVLLTVQAIDNRYPLFSAPRTYRGLFRHYCLVDSSSNYLLLERIHQNRPRKDGRTYSQRVVKLGQKIELPITHSGEAVDLAVDIRPSIWGHVIGLLYHPSGVFVDFYLKNGATKGPYRFIYKLGGSGLQASPFLDSNVSLSHWLSSGTGAEVKAIRFSVHGYRWEYSNPIRLGVRVELSTPTGCPVK